MVLKSIFTFTDYRKYLKHYYDFCKREDPSFTYAAFSNRIEVKSRNFLKLVIDGKRTLTNTNIVKIAQATAMTFEETLYFETLVFYQQAKTAREKSYYLKKRKTLVPSSKRAGMAKVKTSQLFDRSYYPLLLLYLHGRKSSDGLDRIATVLNINNVEQDLATFLRLGILTLKKGRYALAQSGLIFDDTSGLNVTMRKYFQEGMTCALEKMEREFTHSGHLFASQHFRLHKKYAQDYHDKLLAVIAEISAHSDDHPGDDYYLLNMQMLELFSVR